MPQINSPKKKDPDAKAAQGDLSKVVSAYSEEGEARIKQSRLTEKKLRYLAAGVFLVGLITVAVLIVLAYTLHWI